VKQKSK